MQSYTRDEVHRATLAYFDGDEFATDNFVKKYALKTNGDFLELTPEDMHRRMARELARIESKYPNPLPEEEIFRLFDRFKWIVPQGSPMSGIGNKEKYQSISNCFVIASPHDSYGGILKADQEQAQVMKRRGGVGFDISTIRPKNLKTANAAETTDGISVFMQRYSNTCKEVAQGGRRGALMLTIDVHHPEIMMFIKLKRDRKKVTGANVSIRLSDEFLKAVERNEDVQLRFPVEPNVPHIVEETVPARDVWNEIVESAHDSAEPGILFWGNIIKMSPADCYADDGYKTISTNPCLIGTTLIATADGRNAVSIKQLVDEGISVPVYTTNESTGRVEIKWARNPRLTGTKREVWKLTLDDGTHMIATPDHRVLMSNLEYVPLSELRPGQSLVSFNTFISNKIYRQVANCGAKMKGGRFRNRRQYRLISEFYGKSIDSKTHVIHHKDFDSINDRIENLQPMLIEEHKKLHSIRMCGQNNPYFKMSDEWRENFRRLARHPGESNGRYSGYTNDDLLKAGKKLFNKTGRLSKKQWQRYAKEMGYPQHVANEFRFGSWQNFKNQVATNHKVANVEFYGYEDVYDVTVDDNHNFCVVTSSNDRHVVASGICVHNCSEIPLSAYDSCRLMVVNLTSFVSDPFTDAARFDWDTYVDVVNKAQRLMDDMVDVEIEHIDMIIDKINNDPEPDDVKELELRLWKKIRLAARNGRRTGLGLVGIGDTLATLGIKYGSDESIKLTERIYKTLALTAYSCTVTLAKERGAFPIYDHDKECNHPFIKRIMKADKVLIERYNKHGRRNIALTTTAPTGTVSSLTQTTSGIEPAVMLEYVRRRKINPDDKNAKVNFVDKDTGDKYQTYTVIHKGFQLWQQISGKDDPALSPYHEATALDVDWVKSIELQAVAQKWICHAISKTCNLPEETTVEQVAAVYETAWKRGCKGLSVYRQGSRAGIIVEDDGDEVKPFVRPQKLNCDIHRAKVTVQGEPNTYIVLVGLLDNRPYEIFCGLSEMVEIPRRFKTGLIIKNGKKNGITTYNLQIPFEDGDNLEFKHIVDIFDNPTYGAFSRTISLALRHKIPLQLITEQLLKDKYSDLMSFSRAIARVLKGYIPDGTKTSWQKECPDCRSGDIVYVDGCVRCMSCGWTLCE